ncbi:hypothetical protein JHK82_041342 [Glycine max]|uniref:Uncharacterized protein n=1 Tax=Glycine max TaxID=3847 RepID=K7M9G9_SOYBN|nr:hypothetical protein JHK86_041402 [Glycine max]KAG4955628.1 hypothetical protein JHK85_042008 [Glycine max]KAG5104372.1 hypothetical protein JHK82_041342 [Glycine max]KAH1145477.1 hypothetical protein GYH30_041287 [Glycine max]
MESFLSSSCGDLCNHHQHLYTPCHTPCLFFIISNFAYPPFIWSFSQDDIIRYVEIIRVIDQYVDVSFKIFFSCIHTHCFIN